MATNLVSEGIVVNVLHSFSLLMGSGSRCWSHVAIGTRHGRTAGLLAPTYLRAAHDGLH